MASIEDLGARRAARMDATVEEIVQALIELGGSAHRDLIAARLTAWRHPGETRPPERLLRDVDQALTARESDGLFRRVFGAQSNRWTLEAASAPSATPLLRTRRPRALQDVRDRT